MELLSSHCVMGEIYDEENFLEYFLRLNFVAELELQQIIKKSQNCIVDDKNIIYDMAKVSVLWHHKP